MCSVTSPATVCIWTLSTIALLLVYKRRSLPRVLIGWGWGGGMRVLPRCWQMIVLFLTLAGVNFYLSSNLSTSLHSLMHVKCQGHEIIGSCTAVYRFVTDTCAVRNKRDGGFSLQSVCFQPRGGFFCAFLQCCFKASLISCQSQRSTWDLSTDVHFTKSLEITLAGGSSAPTRWPSKRLHLESKVGETLHIC